MTPLSRASCRADTCANRRPDTCASTDIAAYRATNGSSGSTSRRAT